MNELFGNRQKQTVLVLVLLLAGICYKTCDSKPSSPRAYVEEAVKEMVAAAEAGTLDPFKQHLSEQVKDSQGRNKQEILKTLFGIFFRYKNIKLSTVSLKVEANTNPDIYTVNLVLFMAGDSVLPTDQGTFLFTFRREQDSWRVWEIEWQDGARYGE